MFTYVAILEGNPSAIFECNADSATEASFLAAEFFDNSTIRDLGNFVLYNATLAQVEIVTCFEQLLALA